MPISDAVGQVLLRRWRATGLPTAGPAPAAATARAEVARLGAMQAQEFEQTLWSLGRRTGEPRAAVLDSFNRGEYLRTHTLRQTWHFVHRDDLTAVQAATAPRVHRFNAAMYADAGLAGRPLSTAADVVLEAVAEGPATRAEIARRLDAAGLGLSSLGVGLLMMWAELECLVVSGPLSGRQHTYVAWADRALPDRDEAIVRLARRYVASHGPASVADLAAWASLTRTEVKQALAELPVEREVVAGVELFALDAGDHAPAAWDSPQVELLNGYDEYVSGYCAAEKRWLDRARSTTARPAQPIALLTVDGQVAGGWRRSVRRDGAVVEVVPLRRLGDAEVAALHRAVRGYGEFLGAPTEVVLRPVDGGVPT